MSSFLKSLNPHRIYATLKVSAFILGAYLTAPLPSVWTILFWSVLTLGTLWLAARLFAPLELNRRRFDYRPPILTAITIYALARLAESHGWHADVVALLDAASAGALMLFLTKITFLWRLIAEMRHIGRHKATPEQSPAPEPPAIFGM